MPVAENSEYERSLPRRAMEEALRASALARSADIRVTSHEELCAERYRWILLWIKTTAAIVGVSAVGLIVAMWQVIIHLSQIG